MKSLIKAKDISVLCKISKPTVEKYVTSGLLKVADRRGIMRLFDPLEVRQRMNKIGKLRTKGYPLYLIREMLEG